MLQELHWGNLRDSLAIQRYRRLQDTDGHHFAFQRRVCLHFFQLSLKYKVLTGQAYPILHQRDIILYLFIH